ncbi:MAG TPA: putative ABC exporter domain-containing protein [Myxococcota bacterium]|nr:putative ABC exporter domain-containing protein [Myxococcota bacterium]
MNGALAYLELRSRANALLGWLRRLREPRYALGSLVMLAYFGFFVFRPLWSTDGELPRAQRSVGGLLTGDLALVLVFLSLAAGWIFGGERAALGFTEAEVNFLFPAPLERRALVHYRIFKGQLAVVIGALLYAALAAGSGYPFGQRVVGFWVVLSFFNLHMLARAFTCERLLALGLGAKRRRAVLSALLVALLAATWASRAGPAGASTGRFGFEGELAALLGTAPLAWVLAPLRAIFAPLRAASTAEMLSALAPALPLLAAHYLWAMRAMVGFEEASATLAEKRSARLRAVRAGRGLLALREAKVRVDPFALAPRGRAEVAFLWERLIAAGSWASPRSLCGIAALPIAATLGLRAVPSWHGALRTVSILAGVLAVYALMVGPALARGSLAAIFERIDVTKSYPLRGWQVVLGELLVPIALLGAGQLTLITVAALGAGALMEDPRLAIAGWLGAAALTPPLTALMFGAQLGLQLALPAWFRPSQHVGVELGGQRLLFVFGSMLVFAAALIPAAVAAAAISGSAWVLLDSRALSAGLGALAAALTVLAEFVLLLRWLGGKLERLDLASDLTR